MNRQITTCTCALSFAFALAAMVADAAKVGESVGWANAVSSDATLDKAHVATWKLTLPAQGAALPAGATVKVYSIAIASRPDNMEMPAKLRIKSGSSALADSSEYDKSRFYYGRLGGQTDTRNMLFYPFPSGVVLAVGTTYDVKPLDNDGKEDNNPNEGGFCGATLVKEAGRALVMDGVSAYSLIYAIEGEVAGNSATPGYTATLNADATSLSFAGNPSGVSTWAKISVTDDSTLNLGGALSGGYTTVTLDVAEGKTLTLDGTTVSAATIEVTGKGMVSLVANTAISGTIVGNGTIRCTSGMPSGITIGEGWCGNVKLSDTSSEFANINPNYYGNAVSTVTFNGIQGYCQSGTCYFYPCVNFENNGETAAIRIINGASSAESIFLRISGSGTFLDADVTGGVVKHLFRFCDASAWSGSIGRTAIAYMKYKRFVFGMGEANDNGGTITISDDTSLVLGPSAVLGLKGWDQGVYVYGSLDISAGSFNNTVYGTGTVVCSGRLPAGTYTDGGWAGTVAISNVAPDTQASAQTAGLYPFGIQSYGSSNSTIRLTSIGSATDSTAYILSDAVKSKVVLVDDGDIPALRLSNGNSGTSVTFHELAGTGTLIQNKSGIYQNFTINVMTNFTGTISPNSSWVTFGTQSRSPTYGVQRKLFIDLDAIMSVPAGFALWSPYSFEFNGTVNFTTASHPKTLVLFRNVGSDPGKITFGGNMRIKVNGAEVYDHSEMNMSRYYVKIVGTDLVLKRKSMAISYR